MSATLIALAEAVQLRGHIELHFPEGQKTYLPWACYKGKECSLSEVNGFIHHPVCGEGGMFALSTLMGGRLAAEGEVAV